MWAGRSIDPPRSIFKERSYWILPKVASRISKTDYLLGSPVCYFPHSVRRTADLQRREAHDIFVCECGLEKKFFFIFFLLTTLYKEKIKLNT